MISLIAAVGKNLELGLDNKLIWHIPEDLKYFKEVTTGKTVVMGRKTFESIGRPLPNRKNIILSRNDILIDGAQVVRNFKEVLNQDDVFIIGGESIYKLFDKSLYEKEIIKNSSYNDIDYSFVVYKKVK